MKIIFDFDQTLFSTMKLRSALAESFEEAGVDRELFQKILREAKRDKGIYDREEIFNSIIKNKPEINHKLSEEKWEKAYSKSAEFLYADVLSFLEKFQGKYNFYILSYGMENVQEGKIEKSGIKHFFKEVYITQDITKVSALGKFLEKTEKAVLIDDNPDVLSEAKKKFSNVITVRMNRGEGRYIGYPDNPEIDFTVKSLGELGGLLLTKL